MKKRFLTVLLTVCMVLLMAPAALAAGEAADTWDGTTNTSWYSDGETAYTIDTAEKLAGLANLVNAGNTFSGKTITLGANMDLSGHTWTPIGTKDHPFSGVFDGGNHTISGLTNTASADATAGSDLCLGLFGCVKGTANSSYTATDDIWNGTTFVDTAVAESKYTAVIKNLTLTDVTINGNGNWVGALAGGTYHTYISDVTVSGGFVKGQNSVGGVIGRGYGTILKDVVTGTGLTVGSCKEEGSNYYNYGGIAGSLRADSGSLSAAIGCTNNAAVSAYVTAGGIAGVVGQSPNAMVIYDCVNNGAITVTKATAVKPIDVVASGISGQSNGGGVIANCTNNGAVTTAEGVTAGSLAGIANYFSGTIYQSSNTGTISGNAFAAGGLVGYTNGELVTVDSCTNSGAVSSTKENSVVSTFVASGGGNGSVSATYKNSTFADVAALEGALLQCTMSSSNGTIGHAKAMTLQDITVTDTTGVLQLPFVSSFVWEDAPAGLQIAPYESGAQTINVPDAKIVVASGETAGSVTLAAAGMKLVNDGTMGTVGVNGANCIVENNGTMGRVTANGANVQITNNADANCNGASFYGANATLDNYGTITATSTHTLNFGKQNDETAMPTAVVNNYGTITGASGQYLIYAPQFTSVTINNMTGSTMKQVSSWFIAYGSDNNSNTNGEFAGTKGIFNFNYAPGTVKNSSNEAQTVAANYFVGSANSDLELNISSSAPVAKIGNDYYTTLAAAITDATSSDTITLLAAVEQASVTVPTGVTLDLNGNTLKADVVGKLSVNGGTLITPQDYEMVGPEADYYKSSDAILTIAGPTGNITVESGTMTLAQSWWTGAGQTLTVESGATFVIPADMTLNILSTVIVDGTLTVNGTANLYSADATVKAAEGLNVTTTVADSVVAYEGGVYKVVPVVNVTGVTLSETTKSLTTGGSFTLTAIVAPDDATDKTVTWTSSNTSVASVSNGTVTAVAAGTATITVTTNDGGITATCTVTVSAPYYGGDSYTPSYSVTTEETENGSVKVSPSNASAGSTVTITVDPDDGYKLSDLTVLDKNGKEIELTAQGNGKYTFKMPSGKVTVEATFVEAVTENPFVDVPNNAYYTDAVLWAVENGITTGTGDGTTFSPNATCTRAQVVTFLWRAAGSPEPVGAANEFDDVASNAYYAKAVQWAVEQGITLGTGDNKFSPDAECTRGQIVTFLWRFQGSENTTANNPFVDVADGAYYEDAITWAVDEAITNGTGDGTTFSPNDDCTRAQIVTFLYRCLAE